MKKIGVVFNEAKESSARHQKLLKKLEKIRQESNEELFFEEFFKCVRIIFHWDLKASKEELNRLLSFAAKFCVHRRPAEDDGEQMDAFLKRVLYEALKFHDIDYETERYRCCQFVACLLKEMGDEGIDEDAWNAIQNAMLDRLQVGTVDVSSRRKLFDRLLLGS